MLKLSKFFPVGLYLVAFATANHAAAQPAVRIEPPAAQQGLRLLEEQTASAAIRDYLQSWQSLSAAFEQNSAELLNTDFSGTARSKLGETIQQQAGAGLSTKYSDSSHDIQIVFYSPEGLSIELTDTAEYDLQVLDHGKLLTSQHMRTRYLVVLTPAEARWKVHVMQAMD
jgi:hypothetical protein